MAACKPVPQLTDAQIAYFWSLVLKGSAQDCWPWQASTNSKGYGKFQASRRQLRSHRIAFMLSTGVQPGDYLVMHSCDNPRCCNPKHLSLGTNKDNLGDAATRGRMASGDRHYTRKFPELVRRGSSNGHAVLSEADVLVIKQQLNRKIKGTVLARRYSVAATLISAIKNGRVWKHVKEKAHK